MMLKLANLLLQPLFKCDNDYRFVKGGAADISFNNKDKTATIKINKKVEALNQAQLEEMRREQEEAEKAAQA